MFLTNPVRTVVVIGGLAIIQNALRLFWNFARYKYKFWTMNFSKLPWVWEGQTDHSVPTICKSIPMLMALTGNGSLQKLFNLLSDPLTGIVRPVVYFGTCVGFDPCVTICDSKYFSQILNDTESFPKYRPLYSLHDLILANGLVTASGDHHKRQRKLITPVFHFGALKSSMHMVHKNVKAFLEDELPRSDHIIRDSTFKSVTLGVIIDYAFSGAFDKRWMQSAWHAIVSYARLQSVVRLFLANYVAWLPSPVSLYVLLVRCRIRLYLWRRRRLLRERNVTQELVLRAVEEEPRNAAAAPAASAAAGGGAGPGPELSIELGMNLVDQVVAGNSRP